MRPYRLRSSFVSLLLWEGRSLPYVADQAGHSIATLANHYAGVIRSLEEEPRRRLPATPELRWPCGGGDRSTRARLDPSVSVALTDQELVRRPERLEIAKMDRSPDSLVLAARELHNLLHG